MKTSALRILKTGAVTALISLAGCGGGSSGGGGTTAATYTIGGTVLGLKSGASMSVELGSSSLSVSNNGVFTFPSQVADQAAYSVTVGTNPTGQTCGVLGGTGTVSSANVTNVEVFCTNDVTAATLNGTYEMAAFNINSNTAQLYTSVPFDGSGTQGSSTVLTNQAGTTFTTSTDAGGIYTVTTADALPVLTVGTNDAGGIEGVDGDEFFWIASDVNGGTPPELVVGVKSFQGPSLSTLAGNWITVGLANAATSYDFEGPIAIGTDGSVSGTQSTLDFGGAAGTQTATGSYAVSNNVVSIGGNSGYVSANGDFAILSSVTQQTGGAASNNPTITLAVKQATGVSTATLSGIYSIAILGYNTASTGYGSVLTAAFDGAGNFSGTVATNDNGTYGSATVTGTYTISSTGVFTLTDSTGDAFTGGVTADGNAIVAAYLTASSGPPAILVGFRE